MPPNDAIITVGDWAPAAVAAARGQEARHSLVLDQMHALPAHAPGRDRARIDIRDERVFRPMLGERMEQIGRANF